jgi:hypothetical protein
VSGGVTGFVMLMAAIVWFFVYAGSRNKGSGPDSDRGGMDGGDSGF